jgi:hypothetical protein
MPSFVSRELGASRLAPVDRETQRVGGHYELRRSLAGREMATGTLACPSCDAPVLPAGVVSPPDPMSCGFCGQTGAVRDFLSLGEPTRPTRVVVRVSGLPLR